MVSLDAFNAVTFPGYERSHHHLVAQTLTGVHNNSEAVFPETVVLKQNYPNPFNPNTMIQYHLPVATYVQLDVVNILGESVVRLLDGYMPAGPHQVEFNGSALSSGAYLLVLKTRHAIEARKMLVIR